MVGAVLSKTPNYGFSKVRFDMPGWHGIEHDNWTLIDALLASVGSVPGARGIWTNSTEYTAGDRLADPDGGGLYLCLVTHISAATGSFDDDRAAHPSYWSIITQVPVDRGTWVTAVAYNTQDMVVHDNAYYYCVAAHTSGVFATDLAASRWRLIFDLNPAIDAEAAAEAAQVAAEAAQVAAETAAAQAVIDTTYTASGTGGVTRSLKSRAADLVMSEDYSTLQQAITARRNVDASAGKSYSLTGITISNSQSFDGKRALITATTGTYAFTLKDYQPSLERLYVVDSNASSAAFIRVLASRYAVINNVYSPNTGNGGIHIEPNNTSTEYIAQVHMSHVTFEGVTGYGIKIGSSVVEVHATDTYIAGLLDVDESGKLKPRSGTVGWEQNTPLATGGDTGGHQIMMANMIGVQTGYRITDGNLTKFLGCIADSTSGYGFEILGATVKVQLHSIQVGTSMGIHIAGSSVVQIDGLRIENIGIVPSWGQAAFYDSAGPYYALTIGDTAEVTINGNNWRGDKRVSVASTAKLIVTGGHWFSGKNESNIAAGATVYLGPSKEYASNVDALWRAPYDGYIFMLKAVTTAAPGVGEKISFTVQINGVDNVSTLLEITGTNFGNQIYLASPIAVVKDTSIAIKAVKSAGAVANGRYNVDVHYLSR